MNKKTIIITVCALLCVAGICAGLYFLISTGDEKSNSGENAPTTALPSPTDAIAPTDILQPTETPTPELDPVRITVDENTGEEILNITPIVVYDDDTTDADDTGDKEPVYDPPLYSEDEYVEQHTDPTRKEQYAFYKRILPLCKQAGVAYNVNPYLLGGLAAELSVWGTLETAKYNNLYRIASDENKGVRMYLYYRNTSDEMCADLAIFKIYNSEYESICDMAARLNAFGLTTEYDEDSAVWALNACTDIAYDMEDAFQIIWWIDDLRSMDEDDDYEKGTNKTVPNGTKTDISEYKQTGRTLYPEAESRIRYAFANKILAPYWHAGYLDKYRKYNYTIMLGRDGVYIESEEELPDEIYKDLNEIVSQLETPLTSESDCIFIGDMIWLDPSNIEVIYPEKRFERLLGPHEI